MISTLCFDNITMMSCFIEQCHEIVENQWNLCFDFLRRDNINTLTVLDTASRQQELLGLCLNVWWTAAMFDPSLALLWRQQASLGRYLKVPSWSSFSKLYFILSLFGRSMCSWKCYGKLLWVGFPHNCGFTSKILEITERCWTAKVRSHFVWA